MGTVTAVMIAFKHPEFISAAIDSILAQDVPPHEFIVVDDGGGPEVAEAIAPYLNQLQYIRQSNAGPGAARDAGVRAATGDYVAFCDSDDIHHTFRLGLQSQLLDRYPDAAQVFADLSIYREGRTEGSPLRQRTLGVDTTDFNSALVSAFGSSTSLSKLSIQVPEEHDDAEVYEGLVPHLIAARHIAWSGTSMFRRSALQNLGGHNHSLRYWEDWDLSSRVAKQYPIVFLDMPVLLYRQHSGQITAQGGAKNAQAYRDVVFDVWQSDKQFAADHPKLVTAMVKLATLRNAHYAALNKDFRRGRSELFHCIRAAPLDRHGYTGLLRNMFGQARLLLTQSKKKKP